MSRSLLALTALLALPSILLAATCRCARNTGTGCNTISLNPDGETCTSSPSSCSGCACSLTGTLTCDVLEDVPTLKFNSTSSTTCAFTTTSVPVCPPPGDTRSCCFSGANQFVGACNYGTPYVIPQGKSLASVSIDFTFTSSLNAYFKNQSIPTISVVYGIYLAAEPSANPFLGPLGTKSADVPTGGSIESPTYVNYTLTTTGATTYTQTAGDWYNAFANPTNNVIATRVLPDIRENSGNSDLSQQTEVCMTMTPNLV